MTPEAYFTAELAGFERAFANNKRLRPIFAAVEFCHLHQLPLPEWAALAVMNLILERQHLPGTRGAGNSPKAQARNDYVDYQRWLVLSRVLMRRGLPPQAKRKSAGKPTKQEAETLRRYDDAYAEACELLKKRKEGLPVVGGTPTQVRASFDRLEKARADGSLMSW